MGLLGAAVGCGDPPRVVLRDTLATLNEMGDAMIEVYDEASAEEALKTRIDPLKKKWENVKKRQQEFTKLDKEDKVLLSAAIDPLEPEEQATVKRLMEQGKRIKGIRDQLLRQGGGKGGAGKDTYPSLAALQDLPSAYLPPDPEDKSPTPKPKGPLQALRPKLPQKK
jgi:hypothetical protein